MADAAYAFDPNSGSYADTASVQMSVKEIKMALEHSGVFFINFFMQEKLEYPVPGFHKQTFATMTSMNVLLFACAIPRDHAKTTLAKLSVIWHFLFTRVRFCVYVSCTLPNAVNAVNDIIEFMREGNFATIYGAPKFSVEQDGKGYYKFKINVDRNGQIEEKVCILKAFSTNQKIRGLNIDNKRPDYAVLDDIEDEEVVENETTYKRAKRWLYGPFFKALDKLWHKVVHIGNMVANDCMLNDHIHSEFWHSMHYGCLKSDGTPLWPDVWPLEKLKKDFLKYAEVGMTTTWFVEMMNMPMAGRGPIQEEDIQYAEKVLPGIATLGFITIDPAISEESWACKSAVVAHVWYDDCWRVAEYYSDVGINPVQLFFVTMQLALRWGITVIGIENAAYQASLKHVFQYLTVLHKYEGDYQFIPLEADKRKTERIASWAAYIKEGEYKLNREDAYLIHQLLNYDPEKKRNECDLIDACAYGVQMIERWLFEIQEAALGQVVEQPAVPVSEMRGAI